MYTVNVLCSNECPFFRHCTVAMRRGWIKRVMYTCVAIDIQSCALICEKLNQRWPCSAWNSIITSIGNSIEPFMGETNTERCRFVDYRLALADRLPTVFNHQNKANWKKKNTKNVEANSKFRIDPVRPSYFIWTTTILRISTFIFISRALSQPTNVLSNILHFSATLSTSMRCSFHIEKNEFQSSNLIYCHCSVVVENFIEYMNDGDSVFSYFKRKI